MEYVKFGKSDLNVSKIALGTWAIGGSNWDNYNQPNALKAIESAVDIGINLIDTAPAYGGGHAEELIGKAIHGKRDKVILATKCGLDIKNRYKKDLSPEFIERDLTDSLKRLQTDYIDLYQIHWPVKNTPLEVTMTALNKFKEQGKIRYIGVSNFSNEEILEAVKFGIISIQPQYSLLERSIEKEIQDTCVKNDIVILPYGSLGAGILSGKYKEVPIFSKLDARSFFYEFFKPDIWPNIQKLVEAMREMAAKKNVKIAHIAIAWLLSRKGVVSTLVGARNSEQVEDNVKALDCRLTEEESEILNILSKNIYFDGIKIQ